MKTLRQSPLHDSLERLRPEWGVVNSMATALRFADVTGSAVELADLSPLQRTGLKGPRAADWLRARGVQVPERPNAWSSLAADGLIARLARSEFLIEDGACGGAVSALEDALCDSAAGVYPVLRQDAALFLRGAAVHDLFAQTCSIDFKSIPPRERTVTLTMMIGVAVTVVDTSLDDKPCYRIWCDGTYGAYLWDALLEIATELGGGAVGLPAVIPDAPIATLPQ